MRKMRRIPAEVTIDGVEIHDHRESHEERGVAVAHRDSRRVDRDESVLIADGPLEGPEQLGVAGIAVGVGIAPDARGDRRVRRTHRLEY